MDNEDTPKISFDDNDNTINQTPHNSSKFNPSSIYPSHESFIPQPEETTQKKPEEEKDNSILSSILAPVALILSIISLIFWAYSLIQSFQKDNGVVFVLGIFYYAIGGPLFLLWISCYEISKKGKLKKIAHLSLFLKIITIIIVLIIIFKSTN